jgi:hypothetical protein
MRIVLDTNVLVSAALKRNSVPGTAVHTVQRRGGLLKSHVTEQQLLEVLARPYFDSLIDPEARAWLKELLKAAELVVTDRIAASVIPGRQIPRAGGQRPCRPDRLRRRRSSRAKSVPSKIPSTSAAFMQGWRRNDRYIEDKQKGEKSILDW